MATTLKRHMWTHAEVSYYFEQEGYKLESPYKNIDTHVKTICPKQHVYYVTFNNFLNKHARCRMCNTKCRPKTLEEVRNFMRIEGYTLLSTEYINNRSLLDVQCPEGHKWQVCWGNFQQGVRCPQSGRCPPKNTEDVKRAFEARGYIPLFDRYSTAKEKLHVRCPKGHDWYVTWDSFRQGHNCYKCNKEKISLKYRMDLSIVREYVESQQYTLLPVKYENSKTLLPLRCPKKHNCYISWNNFYTGIRCRICSTENHQSKAEHEIFELYKDYGATERDRQTIKPKELDVYFPAQKLAIEYCGLYWHSDQHERMVSSYHRNKLDSCNRQNVRLLTIFEDEWLNHKDICTSRINSALGIVKNKIHARKCLVKEIDKKEAKMFLEQTHLQGFSPCKVAYGLFYNNELIQVMTFGSPARAHTAKGKKVLEMKRLAGKLNTIIVGGASKLFRLGLQYAQVNGYETIKSYCDLRWGTGNLYRKLGFVLTYDSKFTPHYTDGIKRFRNQAFATNKVKEHVTEHEKVSKLGLYKIYDCGHQTWEYKTGV